MCEDEFDRGIEGKLIELFDVPNGIELNQVKDTLNLLLSSRYDTKLNFWMGLVGQVFQASEDVKGGVKDTATTTALGDGGGGDDDEDEDDDDDEQMTQSGAGEKKERPHWRTRVFAGEVLAQLVELCHEESKETHFVVGTGPLRTGSVFSDFIVGSRPLLLHRRH